MARKGKIQGKASKAKPKDGRMMPDAEMKKRMDKMPKKMQGKKKKKK